MKSGFWQGKRVFVTGHTGFQGSWLSLWLQQAGAKVIGFSLPPTTQPSLFALASVADGMVSLEGNVEDLEALSNAILDHSPEIVIHLAAQALLGKAYEDPELTFATNLLGTVHILEAVRRSSSVRTMVCITSDKCYENKEWPWGYREEDELGGKDPYSASKAAAELAIRAYRCSFFSKEAGSGVFLGSARAGNVIGGGDFAQGRLIPDIMRALFENRKILLRTPSATRPWQHVLDAVNGYLVLAERLWEGGSKFAAAWNFGPSEVQSTTVGEVADRILTLWGKGEWEEGGPLSKVQECKLLRIDPSKAQSYLGWRTKLSIQFALEWTVEWYRLFAGGGDPRASTLAQIGNFQSLGGE